MYRKETTTQFYSSVGAKCEGNKMDTRCPLNLTLSNRVQKCHIEVWAMNY